jgi:hydroxypyruvate reductase
LWEKATLQETAGFISEARTRPLKELAQEIFLETLAEVDVARAFARKVERRGSMLHFGGERVDLARFERIWVVSFGKAAWVTYEALCAALGERHQPQRGVVASNVPPRAVSEGFAAFHAGHPVPTEQSLAAAEAILELLQEGDEKTLVFFLISGGGSALVEKPLEKNLTLDDMQALNRVLVECGAGIDEINAIRKHLSAIKGGRLREAAGKAHTVTFLLSDVPEGKLATIASGPTLPDPTTAETCYEVAARYQLAEKFPPAIRELFEKKALRETPKEGVEVFERSQVFLLLSSHDVLHAAHRAAGAHGFLAECELCCDDWELAKAADCLFGHLEAMQRANPGQPVCLISGGEILSRVTGEGQGGRNQAFVLHCAEKIAGREAAVLSAGTDGIDGNSPAAGAVADGQSLFRAQEKGLDAGDYFRRSDSFHFFKVLGDAILTGPQQNNLRDLRLLLAR